MKLHHILVPIDFSPDAERALDDAIELAQKVQARLTLLHVIYIPPVADANVYIHFPEIESSAQQGIAPYEKRARDAGLAIEVAVVRGTPYQEIVELAKDKHADLIIMGTHGRTGFQHLLLGSVAQRVLRLAPCPVLVTRGPRDVVRSSSGRN